MDRKTEKVIIKKIEDELARRINASTAKDKSIVVTMKVDNAMLIITPSWIYSKTTDARDADMFRVYIDVPKGRAGIPYMCSETLHGMAVKIMNYSGIDFEDENERWIRLMNLSDAYSFAYDMYEDSKRAEILAMQDRYARQFVMCG